jgi:galactitol-specific phosphotransferase system IIC component
MAKSLQRLSHEETIQIWEKVVDTQMHFNEMSVKSRQLGLAFVAAALGLAVVLLSQGKGFSIDISIWGNWHLHVSVLLILAAAFAMMSVRMLDLNVYHKMLRGAVVFGEDFEQVHMLPLIKLQKGMTQSISHFSRFSDASVSKGSTPYIYEGSNATTALDKLRGFYRLVIAVLIVVAIVLFIVTNFQTDIFSGGK